MGTRKTISKRLRFEIFKRDGFRCTYCGGTPVASVLRVDHVVPIAEGGTDAPANLVTACQDCNAGKGAVPLGQKKHPAGKVTEENRDHAEQIREWLALQREVSAAKDEIGDMLVAEWERRVGTQAQDLRFRLPKMLAEFDVANLTEAFQIVADRIGRSSRYSEQIKCLYGVLRRWREEGWDRNESNTLPNCVGGSALIQRLCRQVNLLVRANAADIGSIIEMFALSAGTPDLLFWTFSDAVHPDAPYHIIARFAHHHVNTLRWRGCEIVGHGATLKLEPTADGMVKYGFKQVEDGNMNVLARILDVLTVPCDSGFVWPRMVWAEALQQFASIETSKAFSSNVEEWKCQEMTDVAGDDQRLGQELYDEFEEYRQQVAGIWIKTEEDFKRWLDAKVAFIRRGSASSGPS